MLELRSLPSVDQLLQMPVVIEWMTNYGRPLTLEAIRTTLDDVRSRFQAGGSIPDIDALLLQSQALLEKWVTPTLLPVINASGVVLHTNLGRAPLSAAAIEAAKSVASGYSTLEYDLGKGKRGTRLLHAEALLQHITGAEAAIVVNNNASAVMLVLMALARRRHVVIARSQLVEIGGGFRVPDVMKQSGARLLEVGTTNRIHISDYENALEKEPALFMRAHRSNFRIIGFTSEPPLDEIAEIAHRAGIPIVDDLGSGSMLDTSRFGLGHEPMVQESLKAGVDLVCFSGDKLLGGPQAGIVIGKSDLVARLKKHPLARAIRADKLCLAALSATLLHYLKGEAQAEIPIWRMISEPLDQIKLRAKNWTELLGQGEVILGESTVGGGSLPGETMPTALLALAVPRPNHFLARLRQAQPPIIARTQDERIVVDPRTVLAEQEEALIAGLKGALINISE
jgi:L-seryl-tRNA(Ser) seleniumtransferase